MTGSPFQGLEKDRHAKDIALYCMEPESGLPGFSDEACKTLWEGDRVYIKEALST